MKSTAAREPVKGKPKPRILPQIPVRMSSGVEWPNIMYLKEKEKKRKGKGKKRKKKRGWAGHHIGLQGAGQLGRHGHDGDPVTRRVWGGMPPGKAGDDR